MLEPAGKDNSTGVISSQYLKDATDPALKDDAGYKEWLAFMDKYMPDANKSDWLNVYGYTIAQTLVTALKASGNDLTRANVLAQATNLTRTLEAYRKAGFFVIGLDADGDVDLPGLALADRPLVVVVGSEGKGLSRLVRETCDQIVSIPMSGVTESLNAGIATAVTLYEVAQARKRG